MNILKGYRTYILAGLAVVYIIGSWLGFWELNNQIVEGLGLGSVLTLRAAIK